MFIALSGKMTSGKSLVAKHLVVKYGFTEASFASKVKQIAADIDLTDRQKKDRWRLIQLGEKLREIDPTVWIRYLLKDIEPGQDIVVSDMRFPLEYDALRRLGFILVRMYIDRPTQVKQIKENYPDMPLVLMNDYSETALDMYPFEYTIVNDDNTSLEEVYKQVDVLMLRAGLRE